MVVKNQRRKRGCNLLLARQRGSWTEKVIRLGDVIQVFQIFKGFASIKHGDFFTMACTLLRGHEKVYKPFIYLT